jgi:hypothetical protein
VSPGFDFQSQIIAEILKIVFRDDTVLVQIPGQLDGADYPPGLNSSQTAGPFSGLKAI